MSKASSVSRLLHCQVHTANEREGRRSVRLQQLRRPPSHPHLTPQDPSHTEEPAVVSSPLPGTCHLQGSNIKGSRAQPIETTNFNQPVSLLHDMTIRCKYKKGITNNAWHRKVVFVYENNFYYLNVYLRGFRTIYWTSVLPNRTCNF